MRRILLGGVVLLVLGLVASVTYYLATPPRPMFHNYRAGIGEKGLLPYWPAPPARSTSTGSQEIHVDERLNILVLVILDRRPTTLVSSRPGWTGHAQYGRSETVFSYNGHKHVIDRDDADSLIVLTPDGDRLSTALARGEAERWGQAATRNVEDDFVASLRDVIPRNHSAYRLLKKVTVSEDGEPD